MLWTLDSIEEFNGGNNYRNVELQLWSVLWKVGWELRADLRNEEKLLRRSDHWVKTIDLRLSNRAEGVCHCSIPALHDPLNITWYSPESTPVLWGPDSGGIQLLLGLPSNSQNYSTLVVFHTQALTLNHLSVSWQIVRIAPRLSEQPLGSQSLKSNKSTKNLLCMWETWIWFLLLCGFLSTSGSNLWSGSKK